MIPWKVIELVRMSLSIVVWLFSFDQLHLHHAEVEVDHLPLCTVVEGETLRLCKAPSKVDDMQLHVATDGIDAS